MDLKKEFFECIVFRYLIILFEKGVTFNSNKLEFPLPKDVLCQVYVKFA